MKDISPLLTEWHQAAATQADILVALRSVPAHFRMGVLVETICATVQMLEALQYDGSFSDVAPQASLSSYWLERHRATEEAAALRTGGAKRDPEPAADAPAAHARKLARAKPRKLADQLNDAILSFLAIFPGAAAGVAGLVTGGAHLDEIFAHVQRAGFNEKISARQVLLALRELSGHEMVKGAGRGHDRRWSLTWQGAGAAASVAAIKDRVEASRG